MLQLKPSVELLTNTLASEVGGGGGLILSLSLSQIRTCCVSEIEETRGTSAGTRTSVEIKGKTYSEG